MRVEQGGDDGVSWTVVSRRAADTLQKGHLGHIPRRQLEATSQKAALDEVHVRGPDGAQEAFLAVSDGGEDGGAGDVGVAVQLPGRRAILRQRAVRRLGDQHARLLVQRAADVRRVPVGGQTRPAPALVGRRALGVGRPTVGVQQTGGALGRPRHLPRHERVAPVAVARDGHLAADGAATSGGVAEPGRGAARGQSGTHGGREASVARHRPLQTQGRLPTPGERPHR